MGKGRAFISFRVAGFSLRAVCHDPAASQLKVPCCSAPHADWFPVALEWKALVPNMGLTPGTQQPGSAAPKPCCSGAGKRPAARGSPVDREPSVLALEN